MPGDRLTHEDRGRIADGLAAGLSYTQIARRLDRPTSTVSREVARNGGPDRYRPNHAHLSTLRRARRSHPAPSGPPPTADAHGRDPAAVRAFTEHFAELVERTGVPRTAARVLVSLLAADPGSLTAAELVERLGVSPASVSKAVGYLEGLEVVRRERTTGRRERYIVDDDAWLQAWIASARANARWAEAAHEGVAVLGSATPAGARMEQIVRFFARLSENMAAPLAAAESDTATVLVALVHAAVPLTADRLAAALGWSTTRTVRALELLEGHPEAIDPIVLRHTAAGAYTVAAAPERLTAAQRTALDGLR
ncbi:helix-turn-helix domain-containing protein (plasmid) [Streptomonospora nanhaiensis]|uniref:Helix-turn-helix domain-containing protein n=1 Tax=Streptomonospora nanhaiensis TaxID=1323731 RepID=A0ABY6YWP6_9ACTN|nr:MarR family transcriptional regulator [Streptomonospora nanhaiensis]WAE76834.1 helix-turn-helix domain-containing protein [Streptomonospora nanhaiensis]